MRVLGHTQKNLQLACRFVVFDTRPYDIFVQKVTEGEGKHWNVSSGSIIWSIRCSPNWANHCLTGSAFFDGIDWMIRKIPCKSAISVKRCLPSAAGNFNW